MAYDPSKPAQLSIQGNGRRHLIQDGIEYDHRPPHDPLDASKAAAREREIEKEVAAKAKRVTLAPGEELVHLGRGVYMVEGADGDRGPYLKAQVAHLLEEDAPAAAPESEPLRAVADLTLKEGERLEERGKGWFVVIDAAGQQQGPARRQKDVAHLLEGE